MEIIVLSFFTALGKVVLISKTVTLTKALRYEKWLDLFFAIVMPVLFLGTFHGAMLAAFSGLWFSLMLRMCHLFVKVPTPHVSRSPRHRRRYR